MSRFTLPEPIEIKPDQVEDLTLTIPPKKPR